MGISITMILAFQPESLYKIDSCCIPVMSLNKFCVGSCEPVVKIELWINIYRNFEPGLSHIVV